MKPKRNKVNRRKQGGGKRPLLALLFVVVLLGIALFSLERIKEWIPAEKPVVTSKEERHQLPPRQEYQQLEQQPYTSSALEIPRHPLRKKRSHGPGTVAIIVDDMGTSLQEVRELMDINVPLTFSIIPGLQRVREVAEAAHSRGYQVMIHMPMEPQGYPRQRMESNGLLLALNDEEIVRRVDGYLRAVPYAVGANNHMGSRFTEDEKKMRLVLGQLKERHLFFVDSRTSPRSVGFELAHRMAMETAGRNVFLDNVQDVAAIRVQLDQMAALARKRGSAIAICHPRKTTIKALAMALPELKKEGITFVPVAELVR